MKTSDRWVAGQVVVLGMLALSIFAPRAQWLAWARPLGAALMVMGAIMGGAAVASYARVNRSVFHISPEPDSAAQMVKSGIYSLVRHPTYSGVLGFSIGLALFLGSLWSLAMAAIVCGFFYLKSRYEDALLSKSFPDYDTYRDRTGRFFPRIGGRSGAGH